MGSMFELKYAGVQLPAGFKYCELWNFEAVLLVLPSVPWLLFLETRNTWMVFAW